MKKDRRLSLAKLQIPPRTTDVLVEHTSTNSGGGSGSGRNKWSNNVPLPLSATKASKLFSTSHAILPRSGLRSRTAPPLEKNGQVAAGTLTGNSESSSISSPDVVVVTTTLPLGTKRTTSLPIRTSIHSSSSSSNSPRARLGVDYISQETTTTTSEVIILNCSILKDKVKGPKNPKKKKEKRNLLLGPWRRDETICHLWILGWWQHFVNALNQTVGELQQAFRV